MTVVVQLLSSGADGLMKLWNVRSTECLNTFDRHEDKVWAMTVGGVQEGLVATGGGDARVQIWEDCTLQDKAQAAEEEEVTLLKQQQLSNALQVLLHKLLSHHHPTHPPFAKSQAKSPTPSQLSNALQVQTMSLRNICLRWHRLSRSQYDRKTKRPVCDVI